jgi:hypothetical protein
MGQVPLLASVGSLDIQGRSYVLSKTRKIESFNMELRGLVQRHMMLTDRKHQESMVTSSQANQRLDVEAMVHQGKFL